MYVEATNIGDRKEINWKGKQVETGIFKYPTSDGIYLEDKQVKNDAICDLKYHGGIDQAVYAFSLNHYQYFKKLFPDTDWELGMFGENLTVVDLEETDLHVGDVFKVGEVILEVTKPREPCMKLGVRFNDMKVVKTFWKTSFSGVYFKVLKKGTVKKGDRFKIVKKCFENPTIAEVYATKKP